MPWFILVFISLSLFVSCKKYERTNPLDNKGIYSKSESISKESVLKLIDFVEIPAGTFTMGSPSSEASRGLDEQQHVVTLSSFRMSQNEITFAQYDAFCTATGRSKPSDNGWGRGNRPVINISWNNAKAFADWVGCRLPTEAQWEYACRAGTTSPFNTGNNLTSNQSNFDGKYPYVGNTSDVFLNKTQPVGSYSSNAWGLNDMHGNVLEWCSDRYDSNYGTDSQTNPIGPSFGFYLVSRGGGWNQYAKHCRSSSRYPSNPSIGQNNLGFCLVAP